MRPLYLDMVEDAVIFFDRDGFFSGILEKLRKRLNELGAERVRLGKRWYWRLKRDYKFGGGDRDLNNIRILLPPWK